MTIERPGLFGGRFAGPDFGRDDPVMLAEDFAGALPALALPAAVFAAVLAGPDPPGFLPGADDLGPRLPGAPDDIGVLCAMACLRAKFID